MEQRKIKSLLVVFGLTVLGIISALYMTLPKNDQAAPAPTNSPSSNEASSLNNTDSKSSVLGNSSIAALPPADQATASTPPRTTKLDQGESVITTNNPDELKKYADDNELSIIRASPLPGNNTLVTLGESPSDPKVRAIKQQPFVSDVSSNHTYRALYTFTNQDTNYSNQWNLPKIGASAAWDITTGSPSVTIAIIDTGVLSSQTINGTTYSQPDFPASKMWQNSGETGTTLTEGAIPNCTSRGLAVNKKCNNFDDDGNGKVDDWQGWDFMGGFNGSSAICPNHTPGFAESVYITEDNDAQPYSCDSPYVYSALNKTHYDGTCNFGYSACYIGHGTMVGSTATSATNNGQLIAGVDHQAQVMNLRVLDGYGYTTTDRVAAAVRYAGANGADVINMSLAVSDCSTNFVDTVLEDAMRAAKAAGSVIVAASGNESIGNVCYPASSDNAIAVGASDQNDNRASFSNYGSKLDVVAPGVGIPVANAPSSSIDSLYYPTANGTSLATPHVAGLAGLLKAMRPTATPDTIQQLILERSDVVAGMSGSVFTAQYGYGRINMYSSLKVAQGTHRPLYQLTNGSNNCVLRTSSISERNIASLKRGYVYQGITGWLERDVTSTYEPHNTTATC